VNRLEALDVIPGWFHMDDRLLFEWVLRDQTGRGIHGDLFEIGSYLGKSAVLLGMHARPEETVVTCDIFEDENSTTAGRADSAKYYRSLTREAFEANYLRFHDHLPRILQMSSLDVNGKLEAASVRFAHVDGCHLYDFARSDLRLAQRVTREGGIVVCDDYRSEHTYGAAAAIWQAIIEDGFIPLFLSNWKLYGSWAPDEGVVDRLLRWAASGIVRFEEQEVLGRGLPRLWLQPEVPGRRTRLVRNLLPPAVPKLAQRLRAYSG
jgi:hypothetical protein